MQEQGERQHCEGNETWWFLALELKICVKLWSLFNRAEYWTDMIFSAEIHCLELEMYSLS